MAPVGVQFRLSIPIRVNLVNPGAGKLQENMTLLVRGLDIAAGGPQPEPISGINHFQFS